MSNSERPKLSLYIHIPFCARKCLYCDFLSAPASKETQNYYVDALLTEIEQTGKTYREYQVITVFIGGGTPSLLSAGEIDSILCKLKESYQINADAEITIEINPGTVDIHKLKTYKKCGINRLSIGLQSANDTELERLGRIHSFQDFKETYEAARKVGFSNINVDLMSAIPGQTKESYEKTLNTVLFMKPEHISAYSLIVEEGTPFASMEIDIPDEETDRQMYEETDTRLQADGFHRYEISNYAKSGYECRHNKIYWTRGNYVGLGLGAASMVRNVRWSNERKIEEYANRVAGLKVDHRQFQPLSRNDQIEEFMFLGLRLVKGVSKQKFIEFFGCRMEELYGNVIDKFVREGLLFDGDNLQLTKFGMDVSNYVMADFLLEDNVEE